MSECDGKNMSCGSNGRLGTNPSPSSGARTLFARNSGNYQGRFPKERKCALGRRGCFRRFFGLAGVGEKRIGNGKHHSCFCATGGRSNLIIGAAASRFNIVATDNGGVVRWPTGCSCCGGRSMTRKLCRSNGSRRYHRCRHGCCQFNGLATGRNVHQRVLRQGASSADQWSLTLGSLSLTVIPDFLGDLVQSFAVGQDLFFGRLARNVVFNNGLEHGIFQTKRLKFAMQTIQLALFALASLLG
mmetsp:Transcript_22599/g.49327  ORF Transcript_22599/g.49327 Transcript_22599/m.49327 type:complete len:243 (-) Transcript_22599:700-1428(-)